MPTMVDRLGSAATAVGSCSSLWAVRAIAMKKKKKKRFMRKNSGLCVFLAMLLKTPSVVSS